MKTSEIAELESLRSAFNEFVQKMKRTGGLPLRRLAELQTLVNDYLTIALEVDLGLLCFDHQEEDY